MMNCTSWIRTERHTSFFPADWGLNVETINKTPYNYIQMFLSDWNRHIFANIRPMFEGIFFSDHVHFNRCRWSENVTNNILCNLITQPDFPARFRDHISRTTIATLMKSFLHWTSKSWLSWCTQAIPGNELIRPKASTLSRSERARWMPHQKIIELRHDRYELPALRNGQRLACHT